MEITKAIGYSKLLSNNGNIPHTIDNIWRIAQENSYQVKQLAKKLQAETIKLTCKNIWEFVRYNIKYENDSQNDELEILRTPARTWAEKKGDCDCFTILISSILINLNIEHCYRIAAYDSFGEFIHIYPIAYDELGNEIIIDCVPEIPNFNFEQEYLEKKDYCMKTYELGKYKKHLGNASSKQVISDLFGAELDLSQSVNAQNFAVGVTKAMILKIEETLKSYPNYSQNTQAMLELSNVEKLKSTFDDIVMLTKILKEYSQSDSMLKDVYELLFNSLVTSTQMPEVLTISEYINYPTNNTLGGFLDALNPITAITGAISSIGAVGDKIFGGEKRRLEIQRETQQEQTKATQIAAQAQLEIEKLKLEQEQVKSMQMQRATVQNMTNSNSNTDNPEDKKGFFEKYWKFIAGGLGLVVLVVVLIFFFRKKKKPLEGVRKKRKPNRKKRSLGSAKTKSRRVKVKRRKPALGRQKMRNPKKRTSKAKTMRGTKKRQRQRRK